MAVIYSPIRTDSLVN